MAIFSELNSIYYRIAAKLLAMEHVTERTVTDVIIEDGFCDSMLFLPQKLVPQKDGSDWGLFGREGSELISILRNKPRALLKGIEREWLAARLDDPKLGLFLTDETIAELREVLRDTKPLYDADFMRYTDMYTDGDPFADKDYRRNFGIILGAVRSHELLEISFRSGHDNDIKRLYLPLKLEYSVKNDKFRLHCFTLRKGRISGTSIVNLGRIDRVRRTGKFFTEPIDMERYFRMKKAKEPISLRITQERSAMERFLMEFASYEKHTDLDLATGICSVELYYDKSDETELLVRLLGFGPTLEILGPPGFRQRAAERVEKQYALTSL